MIMIMIYYFIKNFKNINPLICFSVKSNSNPYILRFLGKLGSGADVVSYGELLKALKSGIKPNKIVFSGVGKTTKEITFAIEKKVLLRTEGALWIEKFDVLLILFLPRKHKL